MRDGAAEALDVRRPRAATGARLLLAGVLVVGLLAGRRACAAGDPGLSASGAGLPEAAAPSTGHRPEPDAAPRSRTGADAGDLSSRPWLERALERRPPETVRVCVRTAQGAPPAAREFLLSFWRPAEARAWVELEELRVLLDERGEVDVPWPHLPRLHLHLDPVADGEGCPHVTWTLGQEHVVFLSE